MQDCYMNKNLTYCITGIMAFYSFQINSVTFVYNLRIAESTRRQALQGNDEHPFIAAVTGIEQFRERYIGSHQNTGGVLGTFLYSPGTFYVRADGAVAKVKEKFRDLCFSRTQSDDILLMGGYSHTFSQKTQGTVSGLFGIPTHKDLGLQGIQFGTGHVGLGAQAEASYKYIPPAMIIMAARYVRFFPRNAPICLFDREQEFRISLGNLVDILISHYANWHQRHWIEIGYNATFAFGADVCPALDDVAQQISFIRNSFYANYKYGFLIRDIPNALIVGFSYGFDSRPKEFGFKKSLTGWLTWGVKF